MMRNLVMVRHLRNLPPLRLAERAGPIPEIPHVNIPSISTCNPARKVAWIQVDHNDEIKLFHRNTFSFYCRANIRRHTGLLYHITRK